MRIGRLSIEKRLLFLPFIAAVPAIAVSLYFVWTQPYSNALRWTVTTVILGVFATGIHILRRKVIYSLRTVSSLLSALREGDYAMRAQRSQPKDALGEILTEINAFGESLQQQRFGSVESAVLLSKVLEEIDVAVLGFDREQRLRLINRRGQALLGQSAAEIEGCTARSLGVVDWLDGVSPRIVDVRLGGQSGRWELRRGTYHEGGHRHLLLVLSDLTPALRDEERQAWRRLLQVLRHEVNNSLAPIQSLATSLSGLIDAKNCPADSQDELKEGLEIISTRSRSLSRFMSSYTRLTALPKPNLAPIQVDELVRRVIGLESRMEVVVKSGPKIDILADSAQMEQLLINLVRNAVEAVLETSGTVEVFWILLQGPSRTFELTIEDSGLGIANSDNLFVPFYTTKPEGSGIGLVLSRQIAEAHGGTLTLENRDDGPGCRARLRLPLKTVSKDP